jgi:hypothetical protein
MVGPEPAQRVRRLQPGADIAPQRVEGRKPIGEDGDERDQEDERAADEEGAIADEAGGRFEGWAARRGLQGDRLGGVHSTLTRGSTTA